MPGRLRLRHHLGVDDVLHRGGLAAAPLAGPVDGRPTALVQPLLPRLAPGHRAAGLVERGRRRSRPARGTRAGCRRATPAARRGTPRPPPCRRSPRRANLTVASPSVPGRGLHVQRGAGGAARHRARRSSTVRSAADLRAGDARRRPRASPTTCGAGSPSSAGPGVLVPERARRRRASGCSRSSCWPRRWAGCRCPGRGCRRRWPATLVATRLGDVDVLAAAGRRVAARHASPSRRAGTATRSTASRRPPGAAATTWDLDGHQAASCSTATPPTSPTWWPATPTALATFALDVARPASSSRRWTSPARWPGSSSTGGPRAAIGPPGDQRALLQRVVDDIGIALVRRERRRLRPGAADGHRLRQGPGAVRPAHRHVPGDPPQARRHAPPARAGPGGHPLRGVGEQPSTTRSGRRPPPSPRASWARRPP